MGVINKKLNEEELMHERKEVLVQWRTGEEIDLDEALEYYGKIPKEKNCALTLAEAKRRGDTLIRGMSGAATIDQHIEVLKYLQCEGCADIVSSQIDSLTRTLRFAEAERTAQESMKQGRSLLNGFPAVTHGVSGCRRVTEALDVPIMTRANSHDLRLVAEITLAGGFTDMSSGPIIGTAQYTKNIPLEVSIRNWQYIYRLMGYYQEKGGPVLGEPPGWVGVTICPPSLTHAAAIIEALVMAEQGVKNILCYCCSQGGFAQDIAMGISNHTITREYLDKFGYEDVFLTLQQTNWGGKFPEDEARAFGTICTNSLAGVLAGATIIAVKSVQEALHIPSKEANAASHRAVKQVIKMVKSRHTWQTCQEVQTEVEMMNKATRAILEKVLEVCDGDPVTGVIRAFEFGILDMPLSTSNYVKGEVLGARDTTGAVRYQDSGNVPVPKEVLEFDREKLAERAEKRGKPIDYDDIISDLWWISSG